MPKAGLYAAEYRDQIIKVVNRVGIKHALSHKGVGVLYSGPNYAVWGVIGGKFDNNDLRSAIMATKKDCSRINNTWIAERLDARDLNDYFTQAYAPYVKDLNKLRKVANASYATVFSGVSKMFAALPFNEVATSICGAAKGRVFRRYELPVLCENKSPFSINKIPMASAQDMYKHVSPAETFDLVCLSELHMAFKDASKIGLHKASPARQDFLERLQIYVATRDDVDPVKPALTRVQDADKNKIIDDYMLEPLYAEPPERWMRKMYNKTKATP